MSRANTSRSYGSVAKTFHWLTALLIFTAFPLGMIASDLAHQVTDPAAAATETDIARTATLFSLHKTVGVLTFLVALLRILWAVVQPRPGLLNAENRLEATLAETVHWLLYGSLVLVPLTGWIHHAATTGFAPILWPFGQSLPFVPKSEAVAGLFGGAHDILTKVLALSVLLHIAGALKHHVMDGDATLRRMLPGRSEAPEPPGVDHSGVTPPLAAAVVWVAALAAGAGLGAFSHHEADAKPDVSLAEVRSDWQVTEGTLGIEVVQLGGLVKGEFAEWTAAITFAERPDPGPAGKVDVTIAIPSLQLGSVSGQAMGPDYFDASEHPTATFSAEIRRTDTGWEAIGPLTIKGASVPLTLPFDLQIDGDTARMQGRAMVNRLDFGIGNTVTDEGSLEYGVAITVELTATEATEGN